MVVLDGVDRATDADRRLLHEKIIFEFKCVVLDLVWVLLYMRQHLHLDT